MAQSVMIGGFITPPFDQRGVDKFLERAEENGCAVEPVSRAEVRSRLRLDPSAPLKEMMFRVYGPEKKVMKSVYGYGFAYLKAIIIRSIRRGIKKLSFSLPTQASVFRKICLGQAISQGLVFCFIFC